MRLKKEIYGTDKVCGRDIRYMCPWGISIIKEAMFFVIAAACFLFVLEKASVYVSAKEKVTILTSIEDYRIEFLERRLAEEIPQYDVEVIFTSTSGHVSRLLTEGTGTNVDITHSLAYIYMNELSEAGLLADLSTYDVSIYDPALIVSNDFLPEARGSGCIFFNSDLLEKYDLSVPTSYDDLLDPSYRGLISMCSPIDASTGYMFLKAIVNERGEDATFQYFDMLTDNVLQYMESGYCPAEVVAKGRAAIGLGTTPTAVEEINSGANMEIIFFEEGAPYSVYGQGIIRGHEEREAVRDVFNFLVNVFNYEDCELYKPETIYKDKTFSLENYPENIVYANMQNDTLEEKERLLSKWKY